MRIKQVVPLVLAGFLGVFLVQNYPVVKIRFLFWSVQASLAIILLVIFLAGVLAGWSVFSIRRR